MFAISDSNNQYYFKPIQVDENGKNDFSLLSQIVINLA
jgi:hypothetical protein